MAAQTQGAVDALLGLLSTAIKDEAKLMGGVPGNMQFIKDEMDSMNGFLTHLTKMEDEHDDQVRAWMKQVREIAYMSEDCVERYVRDILPYLNGGGAPGFLYINMICFFLRHPNKYCELRTLGNQLGELKLRVREVGQRRERYGVRVPDAKKDLKPAAAGAQGKEEEEKRGAFRRALEDKLQQPPQAEATKPGTIGRFRLIRSALDDLLQLPPQEEEDSNWAADYLFSGAILGRGLPAADHGEGSEACKGKEANKDMQLPADHVVRSDEDAQKKVVSILKKCWPDHDPPAGDEEAAALLKMFLCALYVYPYTTKRELESLDNKLLSTEKGGTDEARREQVMIFCYSMLSTEQKSCLQYLTAFLHETEISRTSMVRRWVAERLVGKEEEEEAGARRNGSAREEAGERCFSELLFRGFVRPRRESDAGTVKSCVMEERIRDFISSITMSENFLLQLPAHLDRQLTIRDIVKGSSLPPPPPPPQQLLPLHRRLKNAARFVLLLEEDQYTSKKPMDKLVDFLDGLPDLYRLNVLDLGGCTGLKRRHLWSFRKLVWLRYLSLRDTDVSRLHYCDASCGLCINRLRLLETLDIRGTKIPAGDTRWINLPKLKHLLADRRQGNTSRMPYRISRMKNMQTLSHVQVSKMGTELEGVVRLRSPQQLRKLGVIVHGNQSTAEYLSRVMYALAPCLRSLSIWVITLAQTQPLDIPTMQAESSMVLENLDIKGKMTVLPSWIGSRAQRLANVTLRDTELSGREALRRLAGLPGLRCLKLVGEALTEQVIVFSKDVHFQALRFLIVEGTDAFTASTMEFADEGAAPKLEKIVWAVGSGDGGSGSSSRRMKMKTGNTDRQDQLIIISGTDKFPSTLKVIELRGDFNLPNLLEETKKVIELRGDFNLPNLLEETKKATLATEPYCRYVSSPDRKILFDKAAPPINDKNKLSLHVRVFNRQ